LLRAFFGVPARFTFIGNPGSDAHTTTAAFWSS